MAGASPVGFGGRFIVSPFWVESEGVVSGGLESGRFLLTTSGLGMLDKKTLILARNYN